MREIAKIERMSIRDISIILKEEEARRQKYKQQEISSKAYKLFSEGKTPVQVATILNLSEPEATILYREYWKLKQLHKLNLIYKETNGKLRTFLKLYQRLVKKNGMNIAQVVNVVEIAIHKLPYMETLYRQIKDEVNKLQYTRQSLVNDIEARKYKISILDKIAFTSEQDCKRTEQRVQELADKKDRLEKFIANILNGKGYSKLKEVAKENVKAVLSDNKIFISTAFVALIQTIKAGPQMVKLIQNIPGANDDEQYKDNNNNNATKYLESNTDKILNLTEKLYENLVETLTNNVVDTTANSSYNPTLSLPQSSSPTFPNQPNHTDIYGIEESETYHNRKGDIVD
jgi:hypothetical protein